MWVGGGWWWWRWMGAAMITKTDRLRRPCQYLQRPILCWLPLQVADRLIDFSFLFALPRPSKLLLREGVKVWYYQIIRLNIQCKKLSLLCFTKIFICFMFSNGFPYPPPNFLHIAEYRGIIEARAALSSRHDSYLCRPHVPPFPINISPQWTPRVPLAGVHPTQEPVL